MRDDEQFTTDEPNAADLCADDRAGAGDVHADERAGNAPELAGTRHERVLELDAVTAWELLGSSEGLERWLGDDVDLDVAAGAQGTVRDGDELLLTEVESVEPGRRVSLRWWSEQRGAAIVDLTLEPAGDEHTRLVVTEIPAEVLRVPTSPATIGGGIAGGGTGGGDPQMLAGYRAGRLGGAGATPVGGARRALAFA